VSNYLARVELYDATEDEDYDKLHAAMEERGFLLQIKADDGTFYWLPDGTFVIQDTDMTLAAAHDAAVAAAGQTGLEFSVMLVEFENTQWTNLEQVDTTQN
jgi:hypothetical protein